MNGRRHILPWGLIATVLAMAPALSHLQGCMGLADMGASIQTNTCTTDGDCPQGTECDAERSICTSIVPIEVDLVMEVTAFDVGAGAGYLPEQYFAMSGRLGSIDTQISLGATTQVYGAVRNPDDGTLVQARMEFNPVEPAFPGSLRSDVTTSTSESPMAIAGVEPSSYDFASNLLPGRYSISMYPQGTDAEKLPPLHLGSLDVSQIDSQRIEVVFPPAPTRVSGTVRLSDLAPVPGRMLVWAEDPAMGRRVSNIYTTSAEEDLQGRFEIVLSPGTETIAIRSEPATGTDDPTASHYPSITFGPWTMAELDVDGDGIVDLDAGPVVELALPDMGRLVLYKAKIEGLSSSGSIDPIADVSVKFSVEQSGSRFTAYGITNAAGEICQQDEAGLLQWGVALVENDWTVSITPPIGIEYETLYVPMVRVTFTGDGIQMGQVFQLDRKHPLVGQVVLSGTYTPLEGLIAEAYPVRAIETGGEGHALPRFTYGVTGIDGLLRLDLDAGVYDLLVRGSASSGVPWTWISGVAPGNESSPITIAVPSPAVLEATVLGPDGSPATGALVAAYEVVYSPVPDEPPSTRLVWETTTDGLGAFSVLIAP